MILLDLRMPDMNGVEFIRAVRGTRFADIPIIATTAERETSELLRRARELACFPSWASPVRVRSPALVLEAWSRTTPGTCRTNSPDRWSRYNSDPAHSSEALSFHDFRK